MAEITKPLYRLLEKDCVFKWSDIERCSFSTLKISEGPTLCSYDLKLPLVLACDASNYGVGAVISHKLDDNTEKPIAFANKTLDCHQRNYSQVEKEGLEVVFALKKFNQYLHDRKFTITVDNKAIYKMFDPQTAMSPVANSRLVRWSLLLNQYDYSIEFKSTENHGNADILSRLPCPDQSSIEEVDMIYSIKLSTLPVTVDELRRETENVSTLVEVAKRLKSWKWEPVNDQWRHYYHRRNEFQIEDGILMLGIGVVIPKVLRDRVLTELHQGHPGIVKMKALSRLHVWYPDLNSEIEKLVKSCHSCINVANEMPKSIIHPWSWSTKAIHRIHVDFFEYENSDFLIFVDSYSKWIDVAMVKKTDTRSTICCLIGFQYTDYLISSLQIMRVSLHLRSSRII